MDTSSCLSGFVLLNFIPYQTFFALCYMKDYRGKLRRVIEYSFFISHKSLEL